MKILIVPLGVVLCALSIGCSPLDTMPYLEPARAPEIEMAQPGILRGYTAFYVAPVEVLTYTFDSVSGDCQNSGAASITTRYWLSFS